MADRRNILVPLLILGFIFLSPDPARHQQVNRFHSGPTFDDLIDEERRSLSALQNSSFRESGLGTQQYPLLNLTGLEPDRGYAWDALNSVQGRWQQHAKEAGFDGGGEAPIVGEDEEPPVALYQNVTGYVYGQWVRSKVEVQVPQLNLTEYAPANPFGHAQRPIHSFGRNITGDTGALRFRLRQKEGGTRVTNAYGTGLNVTEMEAEMTLTDEQTMLDYGLRLPGVYFPETGQAVLTTTSSKFAGIFMLPHLITSQTTFDAARKLLNETIATTIQRQVDKEILKRNPWSAATEGQPTSSPFSHPQCELIVYLQQHSPVQATAAYTSSFLSFLECELRFPTGAFIPSAPEVRFSMVAFSPDCGYIVESKGPPDYVPQEGTHLVGPKSEMLNKNSRHHLLFFTVAIAAQLFLLIRQMREASTPSTRSRISYYTIAMMSIGDGFTTMSFLLVSLFIGGLWINLVGTAFLAFISVTFFGMRFLMDIWTVQAPEREAVEREEAEREREREVRFREALETLRQRQVAIRAAQNAMFGGDAAADGDAAAVATTEGGPQPPTTTPPAPPSNVTQPANAPAAETAAPPPPPRRTAPPQTAPPPPPPPTDETTTTTNPTTPPQQPPTQPPTAPPRPTVQPPTDTGATPVIIPSDQDDPDPLANPIPPAPSTAALTRRQTFGALYTRFYLLLLASLFLSLNATTWPPALQRPFFLFLATLYLSLWLPQIYRNVQRNCRKALNWEFVAGQSALRLVPFAYFYGYAGNVLFVGRNWGSLGWLGTWVWVQILVLGSQELVGPRWFLLRSDWAPPAYDYHPVLREDEEGATLPIGFSDSMASPTSPTTRRRSSTASLSRTNSKTLKDEGKGGGKRTFDCAICMQDLEVAVVGEGESVPSGPAGLLARRAYMVTPCRHIFHSGCLEGWMRLRLVCPICRETLPAL